jgi:hypothetical protein
MPLFVTPRQRTLEWSGTLTGYVSIYVLDLGPQDEYYYRSSDFRRDWVFGWIECYGMITDGFSENKIHAPGGIVPADATHMFVRCTAHNFFDDTETTVDSPLVAIPSSGLAEIAFNGSFVASVQCEQVGSVEALDPLLCDPDGFPAFGGTAAKDGLPGLRCDWYERSRATGTYTLSVTAAGVTATESGTCGGNLPMDHRVDQMNYVVSYGGELFSGLSESTLNFLDADLPFTWEQSQGSGGLLERIVAAGTGLRAETGNGGVNGIPLEARIYLDIAPPRRYHLLGRIRTMETRGLGHWPARWLYRAGPPSEKTVTLRPDVDDIESQQFYWLRGVLGNAATSTELKNDIEVNRIYLTGAGLASNRDDTRDWRLQFSGVRYPAFTCSHASSTSVDEGDSTSGWANDANTTISTTGSAIQLIVSGGTGRVTRTLTGAIWEAYRYLRLRVRCTSHASATMRLEVGSKTWDFTASNAWSDITLDLLCPHNASASTDGQDSRFPLASLGGPPSTEGPLWGINQPGDFRLTQLEDGRTYEIDWVRLVRQEWARGTFLPSFQEWIEREVGGAIDVKPFALADVDGRVSAFEATDMLRDRTVPVSYEWRTITQLIGDLNAITGWTAIAAGSFPDTYHTNDREAALVGGGGATITGNAWTDSIDLDIEGGQTVHAQSQFDQVQAFPCCGDVWDYTATFPSGSASAKEKACPLRVNKVLRGQAVGCVFKDSNEPYVSASLAVFETANPANTSGTATTGLRGEYQSGAPFGRGNIGQTIELRGGDPPYLSLTDLFQNRRRYRSSFRQGGDGASYPSVDVSMGDTIMRSYIRDGTVRIGWAGADLVWTDSDTGISAEYAKVRFFRDGVERKIALVHSDGTTVCFRTSLSITGGFGMPMTIGNGDHCCVEIARSGEVYVYWRDGTTLKGTVLDAQGNVLQPAFTVVASGVDDSALDAREHFLAEGQWQMILIYSTGGSVTTLTSLNGKEFS